METNVVGIYFLFRQNSETTQTSQYFLDNIFGREELKLVSFSSQEELKPYQPQ